MLGAGFAKLLTASIQAGFRNAVKAVTVLEFPGWLREFFEVESGPNNLLDPSNPDRALFLGASDGAVFDADFCSDTSGPSLDLG